MSRIAGPEVPPIEFEGLRYSEILCGTRDGLDQRTGYLAVTDLATRRSIANVKAYPVDFDPDEEADVQDVFFTRLELDASNRRLFVESELGQRSWISIDDLTVTPQA